MSGTELLHISFLAVVVVVLLAGWIGMVLYADEHPPAGKPEAADPGDEVAEIDAPERKAG